MTQAMHESGSQDRGHSNLAPEMAATLATRWLVPIRSSEDIPRTPEGLLDSDQLDQDWYVGEQPISADGLIGTPRSYVVLAPGGAGKTTLIEGLKARESDSQSIDLLMHSPDSLASALQEVTRHAQRVYIDALEDALQLDLRYGRVLVAVLSQESALGVAWRLACRPSSWSLDLARQLREKVPAFDELELLPLDLKGSAQIAGRDAQPFLAAVQHARLTRQLASPLHTQDLLTEWRETGRLPATRSEAMRHTITRLLDEHDQFLHPARQQGDEIMVLVAERLAALTLFCGVDRFAVGSVASRSDKSPVNGDLSDSRAVIAATAVPLEGEPDLGGAALGMDAVREVLGTSLFSAAPDGSRRFAHQTYAEYLSAAYLKRRGVTGRRLVSLLGADLNGIAPGPMIEVLGWMLALGSDVPTDLIHNNAKALLDASGLELTDDGVRERIVDGLLRGAAKGTIDEGWGLDTSSLAHPNLGAQLRAAAGVAVNRWEVFWVARIARHCAVFDLADELLALANDPSWPPTMRAEAIQSFDAVAPVDRLEDLDRLLDLDETEDPDDEILAAALRAMLRGKIAVNRVVSALRQRRTPVLSGNYVMLLHQLPTLIGTTDALPLLRAGLARTAIDEAFTEHITAGLLARVWEGGDIVALRKLGELVGRESATHAVASGAGPLPWEHNDDPQQRRVIAEAVLTAASDSFLPLFQLQLLRDQDLAWLIDWMEDGPAAAVKKAEPTLRRLAWNVVRATSVDDLPIVSHAHPAHAILTKVHAEAQLEPSPKSGNGGSSDGRALAENPSLSHVRDAIDSARDDLRTWWRVVIALAGDRPSINEQYAWDLTARRHWSELKANEQEVCWQLAIAYAEARQPDMTWAGFKHETLSAIMPDWSAVFSIATAAVHRPDLLQELSHEAWERQAAAIVAVPPWVGTKEWRPILMRAAPSDGRTAITAALRQGVLTNETLIAFHSIEELSDPGLLDAIATIARDAQQPCKHRGEALDVLAQHEPYTAVQIARSMQAEKNPPIRAETILAEHSPEEVLAPRLQSDSLGSLAPLPHLDLMRLSQEMLADFAQLLLKQFPFTDDHNQPHAPPEIQQLRIGVLQTMADRGMAGGLDVLTIDQSGMGADLIRHLANQAREEEALVGWNPLQPSTLMKVIKKGDARLVQSSAGLVAVLLEQLDSIQQAIEEKAMFRSIWDGEPGTKDAKPKVEDDISDWLSNQLELRLPHVVVDREIQVTRRKRDGIGTRMDITVTSPTTRQELGRIPFEAKRVQNDELLTALGKQLVDQYMVPDRLTHGIYIVYWVHPSQRPIGWNRLHADPEALAATLRMQAAQHRPSKQIEVVVLRIGPLA